VLVNFNGLLFLRALFHKIFETEKENFSTDNERTNTGFAKNLIIFLILILEIAGHLPSSVFLQNNINLQSVRQVHAN